MSKFVRAREHKAPEAQGGAFAPLKPGWYEATIYAVDNIEFSKKEGYEGKNEGWNIQYRISDGQNGANRRVFSRYYIGDVVFPSGSDNFSLFDLGDAVTGGKFRAAYNEGEAELPDRGDLLGRPVEIRLVIKPYNGEDRNEVASVRAPGGPIKPKAKAATSPSKNTVTELDL